MKADSTEQAAFLERCRELRNTMGAALDAVQHPEIYVPAAASVDRETLIAGRSILTASRPVSEAQ